MQFMGEFDDLAILVIEAVFEFLVLMVIFIEWWVHTAFIEIVFDSLESLVADIFGPAFAQIFLLQLL